MGFAAEAREDSDQVRLAVQSMISQDPSCQSVFGTKGFTLGSPTQSSMSSSTSSINGVTTRSKTVQLVMPVAAASTGREGMVEVTATSGGGELTIDSLRVNVLSAYGQLEQVIRVPVRGGGGGRGRIGKGDRGTVIDV